MTQNIIAEYQNGLLNYVTTEVQSLHFLHKRPTNTHENFIRGMKKAVKIQAVFEGITQQLSNKAKAVALTGFLTVAPFLGVFNGKAHAGEPVAQTASASVPFQQKIPLLKYNFAGEDFKKRFPKSTIPGAVMLMAERGEIVVVNFINPGDPHSEKQRLAIAEVLREEAIRMAQIPLKDGERLRRIRFLDVDATVFKADFHVAYANNSMGPNATTMPVGSDGPLVPFGKISVDASGRSSLGVFKPIRIF